MSVIRSAADSIVAWADTLQPVTTQNTFISSANFPILEVVGEILFVATHNKLLNATSLRSSLEQQTLNLVASCAEAINTQSPQPFSASLDQALIATQDAALAWLRLIAPLLQLLFPFFSHFITIAVDIVVSAFLVARALIVLAVRYSFPYLRRSMDKAYTTFVNMDTGTRHALLLFLLALLIMLFLPRYIAKQKYIPRFLLWIQGHRNRIRRRYDQLIEDIRLKSRLLAAVLPHLLSLIALFFLNWLLPQSVRGVLSSPLVFLLSGFVIPLLSGLITTSLVDQYALGKHSSALLLWSPNTSNSTHDGVHDDHSMSISSSSSSSSSSPGGLRRRVPHPSTYSRTTSTTSTPTSNSITSVTSASASTTSSTHILESQLLPDATAFNSIPEDIDRGGDISDADEEAEQKGQPSSSSTLRRRRADGSGGRRRHSKGRRIGNTRGGGVNVEDGDDNDPTTTESDDSHYDEETDGENGNLLNASNRHPPSKGQNSLLSSASLSALLRSALRLTDYFVCLGLMVALYMTPGSGHLIDLLWSRFPLTFLLLLWWLQNGGSSFVVGLLLRGGLRRFASNEVAQGSFSSNSSSSTSSIPTTLEPWLNRISLLLPASLSSRIGVMQRNGSILLLPCVICLITPTFITRHVAVFAGLIRPAIAASLAIDALTFASQKLQVAHTSYNAERDSIKKLRQMKCQSTTLLSRTNNNGVLSTPVIGGSSVGSDNSRIAGAKGTSGDEMKTADSSTSTINRVLSIFTPSRYFTSLKTSTPKLSQLLPPAVASSSISDSPSPLSAVSQALTSAQAAERSARKELSRWLCYYSTYLIIRCLSDIIHLHVDLGFESHLLLLLALYFQLLDGTKPTFRLLRRLPFISSITLFALSNIFVDLDDPSSPPSQTRSIITRGASSVLASSTSSSSALNNGGEGGETRIRRPSITSSRVVSHVLAGLLSPAIALPRSVSSSLTSATSSRSALLSLTARPTLISSSSLSSRLASQRTRSDAGSQSALVSMPPGGPIPEHDTKVAVVPGGLTLDGNEGERRVMSRRTMSRVPQASKRQWEMEREKRDTQRDAQKVSEGTDSGSTICHQTDRNTSPNDQRTSPGANLSSSNSDTANGEKVPMTTDEGCGATSNDNLSMNQ